jgi:ArsR family transcriptional regulator, arsenate/arsenite/antimonite-responsive transcriptional repressor
VDRSTVLEQSASVGDWAAFAALGDPARLAILRGLGTGTTCVCELAPRLRMAPNLLSYHLRILREAGLIQGRRRGRRIEYGMRPDALRDLSATIDRLASGGGRR